jgi:hypothetical protein
LCMARVSALSKLSDYINGNKIVLESFYPPKRHFIKYPDEDQHEVNYFFYGACNYVLPASLDQKKSRAIGMLFDPKMLVNNTLNSVCFPFDSGACMDDRYAPYISSLDVNTYKGQAKDSGIFKKAVKRYFNTNEAYLNGQETEHFTAENIHEENLFNLYKSVPNEKVDIRAKTIEIVFPGEVALSSLLHLIVPEISTQETGLELKEIRNRLSNSSVETYNDIYDSSPVSDTKAIQRSVSAFYKKMGYII